MSYKFSFADNATYDAEDVNAITRRLVTSGVAEDFTFSFTDGKPYNMSSFNEAGKLLYTSGAVPESYASLKVSKVSDEEILINPGMAFFDDGAVIEIEAGGQTLSYVSGVKNYVYLKNELNDKNICYPYCGIDAPSGDCVLLAEIDENGVISDKRTYARGKLPGYQSVSGEIMVIDERITHTPTGTGFSSTTSGSYTFDIGNNSYEYILAITPDYGDYGYDVLGIYNISEGTYISFRVVNNSKRAHSTNEIYLCCDYERYVQATFSLNNGILTINMTAVNHITQFVPGQEYTIPVKLILF